MLSPLVGVVVPVGNLDGTIDSSMPGVKQFFQTDEPGDTSISAYVHVAPGGFATVRFRAQGPHPQDDVEDKHPPHHKIRKLERTTPRRNSRLL